MNDTFTLTCDCGCCEGIICANKHNVVYINGIMSSFFAYQRYDKLQITLRAMSKKKNHIVSEAIVRKHQLEDFRDFLATALSKGLEDEPRKNDAHIEIEDFRIGEEKDEDVFSFYICSDMKTSELLRGKVYRCFDIVLNKTDVESLIIKLNKILDKKLN